MTSTSKIYSQAVNDFKRLQTMLADKQAKIGADTVADTFAELGSNVTVIQSFKLNIDRADRFITNIDAAIRKNDTIYQGLNSIIEQAQNFKQSLSLENTSTNASVNDLTGAANVSLKIVEDALNSKDGNNYVFAGSKTNEAPTSNLETTNSVVGGVVTANYYQGDDFKQSVDVSKSLQIQFGVNADDPAIQKVIGAINMAKSEEARGNAANYTEAGALLDTAINELIALRAKVGDNATTFENSLANHEKVLTTYEEKYAQLNEPDVVQLTIESTQAEATLQAAFTVFSRIASLSLVNFLQ